MTTNDDEQIDILARTIWGEARGEGKEGMQAVANVVMNRVKAGGWYGATPKEVCLKKKQFSCWNSTDRNYPLVLKVDESNPQFALAKTIAALAIGGALPDITNGAVNYFNVKLLSNPEQTTKGLREVASIGEHTFFVEV